MKPPSEIILATKNPHKIQEIKEILGPFIRARCLSEYIDVEIKESGKTLLENSLAKALFAFKTSHKPALADDSGLFIDHLNGEPGIISARYGDNDADRIARILRKLKGVDDRRASFKAVFVYYYEHQCYEFFEGECRGRIAEEPRGNMGFGYDPVFIPDGYNKTFAELGKEVKNRISHRASALDKFKRYMAGNH